MNIISIIVILLVLIIFTLIISRSHKVVTFTQTSSLQVSGSIDFTLEAHKYSYIPVTALNNLDIGTSLSFTINDDEITNHILLNGLWISSSDIIETIKGPGIDLLKAKMDTVTYNNGYIIKKSGNNGGLLLYNNFNFPVNFEIHTNNIII